MTDALAPETELNPFGGDADLGADLGAGLSERVLNQDEIDSLIADGYLMDEQDQKDLQELNRNHDPATQIGLLGDVFYEPGCERILRLLKAGLVLPPWKDRSEDGGGGLKALLGAGSYAFSPAETGGGYTLARGMVSQPVASAGLSAGILKMCAK